MELEENMKLGHVETNRSHLVEIMGGPGVGM